MKDFWQRWHISLSRWLRDYVYIPLGGNRKGKGRKYLNLAVTFLASGIWHGAGLTYLLWGGIHGCCQIMGECLDGPKEKIYARLNIRPDGKGKRIIKQTGTFFDRQPCVEGNAGTLICGLTSVCRREKAGGGNPDF